MSFRTARPRAIVLLAALAGCSLAPPPAVVLLTDFGTKDGAVAAMKGVVAAVDPRLRAEDLTHEIAPFDVWEGAVRLSEAAPYWPPGTVFVGVVDPGVGTERHPIVLRTATGHLFVGPDNGLFTLVAETLGIDEVRRIDEAGNRRPGSERSHTFHGRDLFSYAAARLAAGRVAFEGVGPRLEAPPVMIPYRKAELLGRTLRGMIPALDVNFGNVWTNVGEALLSKLNVGVGDTLRVRITRGEQVAADLLLPYAFSFGRVPEGADLLYLNSQGNVSFATNMGSFAERHGVAAGPEWDVEIGRWPR
jgi:hypothetical protein